MGKLQKKRNRSVSTTQPNELLSRSLAQMKVDAEAQLVANREQAYQDVLAIPTKLNEQLEGQLSEDGKYVYKNGVFIPTLEEFKQQEIQKLIDKSLENSYNRTTPTFITKKRGLSEEDIQDLQKAANNPHANPDVRNSAKKQLEDNCLYGYSCATTASSNMPRLKNLATEGGGFKPREWRRADAALQKIVGYFASNSDFRNNYRNYGYELIDDVNLQNGDQDYDKFVTQANPGDLLQRWDNRKSPGHLMTYTGNKNGYDLLKNDSTGYYTSDAIRKDHKYNLTTPNWGTSLYRFVGDDVDHQTIQENYKYLYE